MRRMPRWLRYSLVPAVFALSAFFIALPRTGGGTPVKIVVSGPAWRYQPLAIRIETGGRIAFVNDTRVTHTASCADCGTRGWDTGDIQPGETKVQTFLAPGSYTFFCRYHQSEDETGRLAVGVALAPAAASPSPTAS
jgi:plastocyanin